MNEKILKIMLIITMLGLCSSLTGNIISQLRLERTREELADCQRAVEQYRAAEQAAYDRVASLADRVRNAEELLDEQGNGVTALRETMHRLQMFDIELWSCYNDLLSLYSVKEVSK